MCAEIIRCAIQARNPAASSSRYWPQPVCCRIILAYRNWPGVPRSKVRELSPAATQYYAALSAASVGIEDIELIMHHYHLIL